MGGSAPNLTRWRSCVSAVWHEIRVCRYKASFLLVLFFGQTVFGQNPFPISIFNTPSGILGSGLFKSTWICDLPAAVPALDDWKKEWREKFTSHRATQVAALDFRSPLAAVAPSN
jgi:hypothetical protein